MFRSVNIALVNELKTVLDRMDIDIWEVIEAAKTKPFGFMPFFPATPVTRKRTLAMRSVAKDAATWGGYDAVVVSTAHELFKDPALFQGLHSWWTREIWYRGSSRREAGRSGW